MNNDVVNAVAMVALLVSIACSISILALGWLALREDKVARREHAEFQRKLEKLFQR